MPTLFDHAPAAKRPGWLRRLPLIAPSIDQAAAATHPVVAILVPQPGLAQRPMPRGALGPVADLLAAAQARAVLELGPAWQALGFPGDLIAKAGNALGGLTVVTPPKTTGIPGGWPLETSPPLLRHRAYDGYGDAIDALRRPGAKLETRKERRTPGLEDLAIHARYGAHEATAFGTLVVDLFGGRTLSPLMIVVIDGTRTFVVGPDDARQIAIAAGGS